jgi:hypothetical protein
MSDQPFLLRQRLGQRDGEDAADAGFSDFDLAQGQPCVSIGLQN